MTEKNLSKEEQLNVVIQVHNFLATYDRVPGAFSAQWAQVLEGLAAVAKSLQVEVQPNAVPGAEVSEPVVAQ